MQFEDHELIFLRAALDFLIEDLVEQIRIEAVNTDYDDGQELLSLSERLVTAKNLRRRFDYKEVA